MRIGLKLWSTNDYYFEAAKNLYIEGYCNYIELYSVPGSFGRYADLWKQLNISYIVHAPHFSHGLNLADKSRREDNLRLFNEARLYAEKLNADYIIVHPGIGGTPQNVADSLRLINMPSLLVENKPYKALNYKVCAGFSPEEVKFYIDSANVGFCFDINHAINYAFSYKLDYLEVLNKFFSLKPRGIHLSGLIYGIEVDEHHYLKESNCDLMQVSKQIKSIELDFCTLECPKQSKENLDDFKEEVIFLRKLWESQG